MYVDMFVYVCGYVCVWICLCICVDMSVCGCVSLSVCLCIHECQQSALGGSPLELSILIFKAGSPLGSRIHGLG